MSTTATEGVSSPVRLSYNLWTEPWIEVSRSDDGIDRLGIGDCLRRAHELRALADSSPLVVASLQRLLAAIVQEITAPRSVATLGDVLAAGCFASSAVDTFAERYAARFDLFDEHAPFLQSGDIPLVPPRGTSVKPVSYLFPEEPTATNINHFFHRFDDQFQLSPASAALGLITVAAFATSGGAGIRPSINGVPPLYVLPSGNTLFETLALSVVTPAFQPKIAASEDRPAWRRDPTLRRGVEVLEVGYLESLTFPARRVRFFPDMRGGYDVRTGEWSEVLVRHMVFEMGVSRPKESETWLDPFAAYRVRTEGPIPIRPQEGKTLWREYGNLFHTTGVLGRTQSKSSVIVPAIVAQVARLQSSGLLRDGPSAFRCIGMRTDMKAKVFEWVDEVFGVPPGLLNDEAGQLEVQVAIERAEEWSRRIAGIQRSWYAEHQVERQRMLAEYWIALAEPFRLSVERLSGTESEQRQGVQRDWIERVFDVGEWVLMRATEEVGDRGELLRLRAEALSGYRKARGRMAKEWIG